MALLSPKEVAEKYGFHPTHIRRLIRNGLIKCSKVGKCYVIDEISIRGLKRRRSKNGTHKMDGKHHEDMGN